MGSSILGGIATIGKTTAAATATATEEAGPVALRWLDPKQVGVQQGVSGHFGVQSPVYVSFFGFRMATVFELLTPLSTASWILNSQAKSVSTKLVSLVSNLGEAALVSIVPGQTKDWGHGNRGPHQRYMGQSRPPCSQAVLYRHQIWRG